MTMNGSQLVPRILVLHDTGSADLAALARTALANHIVHVAEIGDEHDWDAYLPAVDRVFLIFDLAYFTAAMDTHRHLRALNCDIVTIGQTPGTIWFVTALAADATGCFNCLANWVGNNLRADNHWSSLYLRNADKPFRMAQRPLAPAAAVVVAHQLERLAAPEVNVEQPASTFARRLRLDHLVCYDHPFVAVSDCAVCERLPTDDDTGAMIQFEPRLKPSSSSSRAENSLLTAGTMRQSFVDRTTGLIKHVFHDLTSSLMPLAAAEMPIAGSDTVEKGFGRTDTVEGSHLVAMLEILERYAGHQPRARRPSIRGSYNEIVKQFGDRCLNPRIFTLHPDDAHDQPHFKMVRYNDELPFDWCWGYSTRRRDAVLLPTQLVYYWLPDQKDRIVNRFVYDSSNGCAMGASLEEAALYGLYEVIERDAYFTSWLARIAPRKINLASITDFGSRALIARAQAEGFEIHLFDMRLDINVAAVMAMIVDPAINPEVKSYCASAAHSNWDRAIFAALVEITTSMGVYRLSMPSHRDRALKLLRDSSQVADMPDHVLLYSVPESWERLKFLFGVEATDLVDMTRTCPPQREHDLTVELEAQIAKVLEIADDVIIVKQGFPEMRRIGVECVKVVVPGLTPVTFGHQNRRFNLNRLNRAAAARNHPALASHADVNPWPHNFP
jgi:ribosomal protein S12 methylthiotransferase accessory factor